LFVVGQSNFHDYEVLRMFEMPEELNMELLNSNTKPIGRGKIGAPSVGAGVVMHFSR